MINCVAFSASFYAFPCFLFLDNPIFGLPYNRGLVMGASFYLVFVSFTSTFSSGLSFQFFPLIFQACIIFLLIGFGAFVSFFPPFLGMSTLTLSLISRIVFVIFVRRFFYIMFTLFTPNITNYLDI